jgi:hypothetical protein
LASGIGLPRLDLSQSITTRLILAFFLVGIVVVALACGITYWLTVRQFRQLTYDQARDRFVADVSYYYESKGNWDGVLAYYEQRTAAGSHAAGERPATGSGPGAANRPPQTLFFLVGWSKAIFPGPTWPSSMQRLGG